MPMFISYSRWLLIVGLEQIENSFSTLSYYLCFCSNINLNPTSTHKLVYISLIFPNAFKITFRHYCQFHNKFDQQILEQTVKQLQQIQSTTFSTLKVLAVMVTVSTSQNEKYFSVPFQLTQ